MKHMDTYKYPRHREKNQGAKTEETGGKVFIMPFVFQANLLRQWDTKYCIFGQPGTCFSPHILSCIPFHLYCISLCLVKSADYFLSSPQGRSKGKSPRKWFTEVEDVCKKWSSACLLRKWICWSSLHLPEQQQKYWERSDQKERGHR